MTADDDAGNGWWPLAVRGLQLALVGSSAYGAVLGNASIVVNGVLSLAVTFLPDVFARRYDHEVDPRLSVWIALAATVHVAGFFGPYDQTTGLLGWYDNLAHAVSASFVAGVGYAVVDGLDRSSDRVRFPEEFRFVFTLLFIMAFGVAWEVAEFGGGTLGAAVTGTEVLVQYGVEDIVADLTFNTLAAVAVALWGTGYFEDVATVFSRRIFGSERS